MIKKTLKNKLGTILIAGSLISPPLLLEEGTARADESSSTERKFILDFVNPLDDFEANSKLKYSLNQLSGKGLDYLNNKADLDSGFIERFGVLALGAYLSEILELTSHEGSHIREGRRYGEYDYGFKLKSFTNFSRNFYLQFGYEPTDEQFIKERMSGLNQNEYNSYILFENSRNNLTFDNGLSFLLAKFWDVGYNVSSNESEDINDVKKYLWLLNKKDINLSKGSYLIQSLIADLLSVQTWDSAKSVFNYLKTGRKNLKPTIFKIRGVEFTPPLINHYLTSDGGFYNITSFINPNGDNSVRMSIGTDVNFIGEGEVNSLRLGVKYYGFRLGNSQRAPKVNPFVSFDFRTKGYSIGTDTRIPIKDKIELTGKYEYNKNDTLENTVKGKNNGHGARLGFTYRF